MMNNTQEAFEKWAISAGHGSFLKSYDKKLGYSFMEVQTAWLSWQANQSDNDAVIAELVEVLEQSNLCISSVVRIESTSFDEPPSPVSEWDYHADMLSGEITRLIAKHKKV